MLAGFFGIGRELDAIALLQAHAQFQRVDGIQAQAIAEQGRGAVDVLGGQVFQVEGLDDELLDILFQVLHRLVLFHEVLLQVGRQLPGGERGIVGRVRLAGADDVVQVKVVADLQAEVRAPGRHLPPFLSLGEGHRRAADAHRRDGAAATHRHVGGAALEADLAVRGRAGAFGEDDEIATAADGADAILDQVRPLVIADVAGGADGAAGKWIAPQGVLDDAVGVAHEGHQQHRVDERRVIGQDQLAIAVQAFQARDFITDHTADAHQFDEGAKRQADDMARPQHALLRVAHQQLQDGEDHQPQ